MQLRNIKNMWTLGIAGLVLAPIAFLFAPFGGILGPACGVFGVVGIVRAAMLRGQLPPAS